MEHSSWKVSRFSVSQDISPILWKLKFRYCVYKKPSNCVLSQTNPVHALASYFLEIHFNIMLPSTPRPNQSDFPTKPFCASLLSHTRATCSVYLFLLHLITQRIFSEEHNPCSSSLCRFLQVPLKHSLLDLIMSLSILFSNHCSWCYS